jgi:hypothetical protein
MNQTSRGYMGNIEQLGRVVNFSALNQEAKI